MTEPSVARSARRRTLLDVACLIAVVAVAFAVSLSAIATAGKAFGWWGQPHKGTITCTVTNDHGTRTVPCRTILR